VKIKDDVYGEFEINEQVLIDLINSKAIQRLKGVSHQGVPLKYNSQPPFSRYDHSIGVMILLRKLGASLEEQIAGLIHDISHTTFSHLIDWVIGDPKLDATQDEQFIPVLNKSDISLILKNYDFDQSCFYNLSKYSLLEKPSPDLCADRIDYALRDLVAHGANIISETVLNHLVVKDHSIVFDSLFAAHAFAQEYKSLQLYNWGDDRNNSRSKLFSDVLRLALDKKIINKENFMLEDLDILSKLENSNDKEILSMLDMLKKGFKINYSLNGFEIHCKFRFIDPKVIHNNKCLMLSELIPSYKYQLELHRKHFSSRRFVEAFPR